MKGTKIDTFKSRVLFLFQIIQVGNTGNINVILAVLVNFTRFLAKFETMIVLDLNTY